MAKALRKNRDDRYPSAEEMLAELKQLESLIGVSPSEKQQRKFKARNANQLLTQFAVLYDADEKTRMPLGELWMSRRFADLKRGKLERELMRKSLVSGLASAWWKILLIAAGTMLFAAWMSVSETWQVADRADIAPASLISVSFSPDGQWLTTGEDQGIVRLWSARPLRQVAELGRHTARVKSVAFSPDGREVVSASDDKTICLWNVGRRKLVTRIGTHTSPVLSVAFSPDGKQIISGEHDHSVRLYTRHSALWGFRMD